MQVRRIAETSTAFQWYKAGDFPGDLPLVNGEGRIVKNYKRDGLVDTDKCSICAQPLHKHGWTDAPKPPVDAATAHLPVDPVSGKKVAPPVSALPSPSSFPKTYEKFGSPTRIAHNPEEEKQALELGYSVDKVPVPSFPKTYTKSGLSDRVVNNAAEENEALEEGFLVVAIAKPAPAPFSPPAPLKAYPKTLAKFGSLDKTVNNKAEEDLALAAGYTEVTSVVGPAGSDVKAVPAPVRTEGIVVHPGWYVIANPPYVLVQPPPQDFEVCDDKVFRQVFDKVS